MKLELFYSETSPYSRKVHAVLLEKGAPFTPYSSRTTDRRAAEVNPLGKMPALAIDGLPLYDSAVITETLDALFPEPPLIFGSVLERAQIRCLEALADGIADVLVTVVFDRQRPPEVQDTATTTRHLAKARACLNELERRGDGHRYLHQDTFSLADLAASSAIGWVSLRLPELLEGRARLMAYYAELLKRPSLAATVPPNVPVPKL